MLRKFVEKDCWDKKEEAVEYYERYCWERLLRKLLRNMNREVDCWERLWIGSQESEAVNFWEDFRLDHKKKKLSIVEKALDWITRKWSCGLLKRLWIGSQESKAVDCWEGFGLDHKKVKLSIFEKLLFGLQEN